MRILSDWRQSLTHTARPTPQRLWIMVGLLLAIFLPRLASLGQVLTVDEPLWIGRGEKFIKGIAVGQFDQTLVAGQPGATTAGLTGLATYYHSLAASQAAIAITTGLLLVVISYFLVKLWGWRWGVLGGFLLALNPFLLAHSRVVHTDALLTLFYLGSLLALLAALEPLFRGHEVVRRYLIFSAVLGALALLTKLFAIILLPTVAAIIFINCYIVGLSWQRSVRIMLTWLTVFILSGYLLWPVLWLHADKAWNLLTERAALHTEGTRTEETSAQSWYYLREIFFRVSTPGFLLAPFGVLWLGLSKSSVKRWSMSWLLLAAATYLAVVSSGSDKSDRYVLFVLVVIELLAVPGMMLILRWLKRWPVSSKAILALLLLPVAWLAIDAARLHPYYLAHYNRFYPIEARHKLGWGEGLETAAAWVQAQAPGQKVYAYYPRVFGNFYTGPTDTITHIEAAKPGDYAVLYRSMFERGPDAPESDIVHNFLDNSELTPEHVVVINGLPYVWIYKIQQ